MPEALASYSNWLNTSVIIVIALVSFQHSLRHRTLFFRSWTSGYALVGLALTIEAVATSWGRTSLLSFIEISAYSLAALFFFNVSFDIRAQHHRSRTILPVLVVVIAVGWLLTALGKPFIWAMLGPILALSSSHLWLGVTVLRHIKLRQRHFAIALAVPLFIYATLPLIYPVLRPTPYAWIGYLAAGIANLFLGVEMLVFHNIWLDEQRSYFRQAFEESSESMVITDPHWNTIYVNSSLLANSGFSSEEIKIQNIGIFDPSIGEEFRSKIVAAVQNQGKWHGRLSSRKKDGSRYTEAVTVFQIKDPSSEVIGYAAIKRDVTRELELQEHIQREQRTELIGHLAGSIAHDFRNNLQLVQSNLDFLAMAQNLNPQELAKIIALSQKSLRNASALTMQLVKMSTTQPTKMRQIDLRALLLESEPMMRAAIRRRTIEIELRLGSAPAMVHADPLQLEQMVINLLINARDAMPQGGSITIGLGPATLADPESLTPQEHVLLTVRDTGVGMSKEIQQRIFEAFFTTKGPDGGTGLGLFSVKKCIEQHSGRIQVESEPDRGTTFHVYLPMLAAAGEAQQPRG